MGVHRTRQAGPSECGPDKQVPRKKTPEGHARRAHEKRLDYRWAFIGPDKRVPPNADVTSTSLRSAMARAEPGPPG